MKNRRFSGWMIAAVVFAFAATGLASDDPLPTKAGGAAKPPAVSHTARQSRPIQLGTSGGSVVDLANGYCCSGTLGALVKDTAGPTQYILSNTHVFAGDSVPGGNGVVSEVGDAIGQPGLVDVSCQDIVADHVANLSDWAPLVPGGTSSVDAAIAEVISDKVDPTGRILEIGTISSQPAVAFAGQSVKKSGRTSGLTTGKVAGLNATVTVQYEDECGGNAFTTTFTGQLLVTPGKFLKSGDSGSLMVENKPANPRPVGLLYAGSPKVAVANPIQDVLAILGVTMVGAQGASAADVYPLASEVAQASKVKARHAARLSAVPMAVGHAIGVTKGRPVIMLLVEQSTPAAQEAAPAALEGIPVEIWEVGQIVAY